jgi:hypothetical protein
VRTREHTKRAIRKRRDVTSTLAPTALDWYCEHGRSCRETGGTSDCSRAARSGEIDGRPTLLSHRVERRRQPIEDLAAKWMVGGCPTDSTRGFSGLSDHAVKERGVTVAGDAGYDTADFVEDCRALNVTPHIAQTRDTRRRSASDDRILR